MATVAPRPPVMSIGAGECAAMRPPKEVEEDFISPTQTLAASQLGRSPVARAEQADVHAKLVSLTQPGIVYEIRRDQKQVDIGRNPACRIVVQDKRASGTHVRIYRDEAFRYFIEELSPNGCWCNESWMKKGDTRALQHGDSISICVHPQDTKNEPFAVYIFRLAEHSSDPSKEPAKAVKPAASMAAPVGSRQPPSSTPAVSSDDRRRHVTEQWVQEHWDMRTLLGSGNFSEVRLGVHVERGEKFAVKVIDKNKFLNFQNKRESHLSLRSEAEVLTSLDHRGIVRFYEWFETESQLFLAMELLHGGDLLQYILEHGCFREDTARRLFGEICKAVRYLHDRNIVHRDLKPENILLTSKVVDTMQPKLADFGLARKNMKTKDCKTFCGTPHYFAPEVIHTFRDRESGLPSGYGTQADMWSLGVILYIMLSGLPPFEEDGLYEQILEGKYEFDVREWTEVSPEAKELVRQLMTVDPKGRLTVQQALSHKWFTIANGPSSPAPDPMAQDAVKLAEAATRRPAPMQSVEDDISRVKRRRTMEDHGCALTPIRQDLFGAAGCSFSEDFEQVHRPLGA
mmetsp:Transcript_86211/g.222037  ORF Transcript_86211/g.222037 Transcript_86211/m.222037 type:complete len:571 (+) Transcript_86211:82-1794(+)